MMRQYLTLLSVALIAMATWAGPRNNILTLKQSITDNDIVFPESFETDTHEMMENWYLRNYTILDSDVENKSVGEVSEDEYIRRLAAMPTVIEMPYNQVVRSYIDRYIKRNRTLVEEMLGMSLYYMPIFEQALEKEGLPLELKYLPVIESALNPNAVSRAGAAGLWQFMVGTGKGLGLEVNSLVDERRDPYRSSEKAATYLKDLYSIYNDWSLAIAAYNCGPGNVNKALKRAGGENKDFWEIYDYLPRETRGYVPAFIAANYVMTYFKRHNISPGLARKPLITDTVTINNRVHFGQIAHVLNMPIEEIRILNPQYRQDVIPGNTHPYTLCLPSQQVYSYIMSEDSILAYHSSAYNHREVVEPGQSQSSSYDNDDDDDIAYSPESRHSQRSKANAQAAATALTASEGEPEHVSQAQPDDSENQQINEVKQIEKAAAESRRQGPQKVHVDTPKPAPKVEKPRQEQRQESRQWQKRNERYADKRSKKGHSQEETYKQSRSSSKRGDSAKRGRHAKVDKPAKSAAPAEYNIKKGESLSEIAEKTGTTVSALRKANGITGDKIKAGDNLKIPGKGGKASSKKQAASKGKAAAKDSKANTKSKGKKGRK